MHRINVKSLTKFLNKELSINITDDLGLNEVYLTELKKNDTNTLNWSNSENINWKEISSAILIVPIDTKVPSKVATKVLRVDKPRQVFSEILKYFFDDTEIKGIASSSKIGENCEIGRGVKIGHNCVIGNNVKILDGSIIEHGVVIYSNTEIGRDCFLKSYCIIGGHGFGYEKYDDEYFRIPHIGNVQLGDNVEIGSQTCINRGTIGSTTIKNGVKIDDSSFIAHNVEIEENTIVCSHVCICGSVKIGKNAWVAPGSMIRDGIALGEKSTVGMGSIVTKIIPQNAIVYGNPARQKD